MCVLTNSCLCSSPLDRHNQQWPSQQHFFINTSSWKKKNKNFWHIRYMSVIIKTVHSLAKWMKSTTTFFLKKEMGSFSKETENPGITFYPARQIPPFAEAHSSIPGFMEFACNSNQDGSGSYNDVPFWLAWETIGRCWHQKGLLLIVLKDDRVHFVLRGFHFPPGILAVHRIFNGRISFHNKKYLRWPYLSGMHQRPSNYFTWDIMTSHWCSSFKLTK